MAKTKKNGNNPIRLDPAFIRNATLTRAALLQSLLDATGRNLNLECGYPTEISIEQYSEMYKRLGVARRVVACLPEEAWALDPEVYEQEDSQETEFEEAWQTLLKQFNLYHYLHRVDELSGIGQFGVLLIGLDDGENLDRPVSTVESWDEETEVSQEHHLTFLRAFDQSVVSVQEREQDIHSPRYSLPKNYDIKFQDESIVGPQAVQSMTLRVHWTRVLHVADGRVLSEVYGTPRMQPVYNNLLDIRKILGGSAEMFWKGAFPGYSFEVNPELAEQGIEIDKTAMREEFEAYSNGLQRYLALTGLQTNTLSPQVSDPTGHLEAQLKEIAMALSVPFRVLFGSEQAQLASGQDSRTWHSRVRRRQTKYVEPVILRPFVHRLVAMGILPRPEEILVDWPDLDSPTDDDKAGVAVKQTQALATYVSGGVEQLIPSDTYLTQVMGMDQDEVDAILQGQQEEPLPELDENGNPIMPVPGEAGAEGDVVSGAGAPVQFNGAQVTAAAQIVKDVAAGELPRESGIGQLEVFFGLTSEQAERVMGTAGTSTPVKPNPGLEPEPPVPAKGEFPPKDQPPKGGTPRPFPVGNFDPDQPRDDKGQWVSEGGGEGVETEGYDKRLARARDQMSYKAGKDGDDFAKSYMKRYPNSGPKQVREAYQAIDRYLRTGYAKINDSWRLGKPSEQAKEVLRSMSVLPAVPKGTRVYRGYVTDLNKAEERMKEGKIVMDRAVLSTSTERGVAKMFAEDEGWSGKVEILMQIDDKKGLGHRVPVFDSVEREVVYPPGTKVRITKIDKVPAKYPKNERWTVHGEIR